jgi:hypothetical protein
LVTLAAAAERIPQLLGGVFDSGLALSALDERRGLGDELGLALRNFTRPEKFRGISMLDFLG